MEKSIIVAFSLLIFFTIRVLPRIYLRRGRNKFLEGAETNFREEEKKLWGGQNCGRRAYIIFCPPPPPPRQNSILLPQAKFDSALKGGGGRQKSLLYLEKEWETYKSIALSKPQLTVLFFVNSMHLFLVYYIA